jgi:outer membrane translocation and assembly module TamA
LPSDDFPSITQSRLLKNAIDEALNITQAPEAMVYLTALSAVAAAIQGNVDVELPTGNICPVSLNTMIIAESGERKSTVENLLTKGIKSFNKDSIQKHQENLNEYKIKQGVYANQVAQIKKGVDLDE